MSTAPTACSKASARGIETFHLSSPRHEHPTSAPVEEIEGWEFFRTQKSRALPRAPLFRELMEMRATQARITEVAKNPTRRDSRRIRRS